MYEVDIDTFGSKSRFKGQVDGYGRWKQWIVSLLDQRLMDAGDKSEQSGMRDFCFASTP